MDKQLITLINRSEMGLLCQFAAAAAAVDAGVHAGTRDRGCGRVRTHGRARSSGSHDCDAMRCESGAWTKMTDAAVVPPCTDSRMCLRLWACRATASTSLRSRCADICAAHSTASERPSASVHSLISTSNHTQVVGSQSAGKSSVSAARPSSQPARQRPLNAPGPPSPVPSTPLSRYSRTLLCVLAAHTLARARLQPGLTGVLACRPGPRLPASRQ